MKFLIVFWAVVILSISGCSDDDTVGPGDDFGPLRNLVRIEPMVISPGTSSEIEIYMENKLELSGLVIPLAYSGEHISLDSVTYSEGRFAEFTQVYSYIYPDQNQVILTAFYGEDEMIDTGRGNIFVLHLSLDQSAPSQEIEIDTIFIAPASRLAFYDTDSYGFVPGFEKGILVVR